MKHFFTVLLVSLLFNSAKWDRSFYYISIHFYLWVASLRLACMLLTWVRCQCLEALAMGSVTWVQAAPNSMTLCGPSCIMSKNAFTPTAALHYNTYVQTGLAQCYWRHSIFHTRAPLPVIVDWVLDKQQVAIVETLSRQWELNTIGIYIGIQKNFCGHLSMYLVVLSCEHPRYTYGFTNCWWFEVSYALQTTCNVMVSLWKGKCCTGYGWQALILHRTKMNKCKMSL